MRNKRGISIVEIIVIVVVIAFLFALIFPAITNHHTPAYTITCRSNLKHFGLIYQLYCDDNQQKFLKIEDASNQSKWLSDLEPYYTKKSNLIICPTAREPRIKGTEYGGPRSSYTIFVKKDGTKEKSLEGSYGINSWIYNPASNSNIVSKYSKENFWQNNLHQNTSEVPIFADAMWFGSFPESNGVAGQPPDENGQWDSIEAAMKHFCIGRHNSGNNVVFMDGSAGSVQLKNLWGLKWHKNFDTKGPWTKPDAQWPEWMNSKR